MGDESTALPPVTRELIHPHQHQPVIGSPLGRGGECPTQAGHFCLSSHPEWLDGLFWKSSLFSLMLIILLFSFFPFNFSYACLLHFSSFICPLFSLFSSLFFISFLSFHIAYLFLVSVGFLFLLTFLLFPLCVCIFKVWFFGFYPILSPLYEVSQYSVERAESGVRASGAKSQLCPLLDAWLWAPCLCHMYFHVLTCKAGTKTATSA